MPSKPPTMYLPPNVTAMTVSVFRGRQCVTLHITDPGLHAAIKRCEHIRCGDDAVSTDWLGGAFIVRAA